MRRKKLLFCIGSLTFGGAEKQTIELLNHLDRSRFELHLCYMVREENLLSEIVPSQMEGIYCLNKTRRFEIGFVWRLREVIRKVSPDLVVCVEPYPAIFAYLLRACFGYGYGLVLVMHTTITRNRRDAMINDLVYRRLANRCEKLVFVCRNQMEYWADRHGIDRKISTVIHNGIDTDHYVDRQSAAEREALRTELAIGPEESVICICAALRPEKKVTDLVDAGRILIGKGIPVKILIVGDGSQREAISEHVTRNGMVGHVVITGYRRDVRPYISLSDVVVICSIAVETFSIAILEAMSLGKPLVASDVGGASEQIIPGENGFLFPAGDVRALAESLETILTRDLRRTMGEKSRELVCSRFSTARMVESYQRLFLDPMPGREP